MENANGLVGALFVPGMVLAILVTLVLTLRYVVSRYKKVPPGRVGIFYGRKYKWADGHERGFMLMSGGGRVQRPVVEEYMEIPTTAFQVSIREDSIPNKDNVPFTVGGVATCKISTDPADLNNAVDALIDKLRTSGRSESGNTNEAVTTFVLNILKGHLRGIIGKLDVDQLMRKRDEFNKQVMEESKIELKNLGIDLMSLVIQDINDGEGYIAALGRRAVADAKAEAETKVAEAQKNQDISVSNARREAAEVTAQNEAKIADANKQRDVLQATYKVEADTERAKAETAFQIAKAAQEQTLRVAQADADAAAATAGVKVQEEETKRRVKELEATVIATANAEAAKIVIEAEANKRRRVIDAQAEAEVATTTAEAKKNATIAEGHGVAAATEAKLTAEARGTAAAKREVLLAEAQGTRELAAALQQMSDRAQLILVLDKLPLLMKDGGDAMAKVAKELFAGIAAPLGQIDSIHIVDMGGSHGNGSPGTGSGIEKIASIAPSVLAKAAVALKAAGIDPANLLKMLGLDASGFSQLFDGLNPATRAGNGQSPTVERVPPDVAGPGNGAAGHAVPAGPPAGN